MWHYPTAGQKKSEGAVFPKEQEVSEARSSERCFGGDASGEMLRGRCFGGDASKGMLWDALGCSGMLWDVLGCSGMLWDALEN